jgi:asparagine synthase (glutamine-hydrolysing)
MSGICGYRAEPNTAAPELKRFFRIPSSAAGEDEIFRTEDSVLAADDETMAARSADQRYACVVDGEILNPEEIRRELAASGWSIASGRPADLILACCLSGNNAILTRIRGAYVFAFFDTLEKTLVLGRDLFGNKILYYADTPQGFAFSTRLSDLARSPWVSKTISETGLLAYLAGGYTITPHTIYRDIRALKPGTVLTIKLNQPADERRFFDFEPQTWTFMDTAGMDTDTLVDEFERLLVESLRLRVPASGKTAVYLSGGRDTTMLCGALKKRLGNDVAAFTLGLKGSNNDESYYADQVAEHLQLEHHLYYLKKQDFYEALDLIPEIYGQPYADISAIPTFVITRQLAGCFDRVLCGDGPDFMFGNFDFAMLYYYYQIVPACLHHGISRAVATLIRSCFRAWVSPNLSVPELLKQPAFFWIFQKKFKGSSLAALLRQPVPPDALPAQRFIRERVDIPVSERLLLTEHLFYGLDDVLYKATAVHNHLAVNLQRPMYDQPLFDFCRRLPTKYKFRKGRGRYLQSRLIERYVPREMMQRPKRGFIVDFVEFGETDIKRLTDRYLTRKRLDETGLLNADYGVQCVQNYFAGDKTMGPKMWVLLMFEMWRERFGI